MLKKQSRTSDARRGTRGRKSRVAALIILALVCVISTSLLAQVDLQKRGKRASGEVSVMSLSGPAAKEYIYAGGRLVATEEPASSGCVSPPSPGSTLVATAQSTTSVVLNWGASAGDDHYEVQRKQNINSEWVTLSPNPATNRFTDNGVVAGTTYLYQVRAVDAAGGCPSAYSTMDLATTIIFTDDPLVTQGTIIKAVHVTELRQAVNAVRTAAALPSATWTDPSLLGVTVKAVHVQEMRNNLDPALTALGFSTGGYTDPALVPASTNVKKIHLDESTPARQMKPKGCLRTRRTAVNGE